MRERKNTVLLFSKLPEVGLVKTRLTTLKDGYFAPEVASALYHCMLFDVVEIISAALADLEQREPEGGIHDTYELVISTAPARNLEAMRKLFEDAGTWPHEIVYIADEGASFDEHYNHAFEQVWQRGADCILSMGADMPALTKADVKLGFEQLHKLDATPGGGIVLAPDQEMGVSVIGWTRDTDFSHTGVFYNSSGLTVLPAYIEKARNQGLPALWLPPIPDVDTMADLYHNVTLVEALNYCAKFDDICPPWRTAQALEEIGFSQIYVAPNDLRDPRDEIDR
ncbi:MAG: DUF2064 domain-containing protein [Eggerthellaceae bacterium]|nr:DUF2064 domain-containing protein [Eggerthellaceae bacterium]